MRSGTELALTPPLELERMLGGDLVAIRSAEADDGALLRELMLEFAQSRRRGRRGRLGFGPRIPKALQPLTAPARLEECLLAIDPHTGRGLGMATIPHASEDAATAAPWVLVREGFRRRGIGTALLERLAARARARDYERFRMRIVVAEQRMLELMRGVGVTCRQGGGRREVDADVPIPEGEGLGVALGAALWAVARGGLQPVPPRW